MTQERNEKFRRNQTQITQERGKESGGSERKQLIFGWTCLRSDPPDFFRSLGLLNQMQLAAQLGWVGPWRMFFVAFLGHIMSLGSATFVAFPKISLHWGTHSESRAPCNQKFLVCGIDIYKYVIIYKYIKKWWSFINRMTNIMRTDSPATNFTSSQIYLLCYNLFQFIG